MYRRFIVLPMREQNILPREKPGTPLHTFLNPLRPNGLGVWASTQRKDGKTTMGKHKQFHDIRNSKKFLSHGVRKGMGPFGFAPCKKKTAPDAVNIKSGKVELVNTPASTSILPDGQEDCKR